jgi:hypothetical protein
MLRKSLLATLMFSRLLLRELLKRLRERSTTRLQEFLDFLPTKDLEERESRLKRRLLNSM